MREEEEWMKPMKRCRAPAQGSDKKMRGQIKQARRPCVHPVGLLVLGLREGGVKWSEATRAH